MRSKYLFVPALFALLLCLRPYDNRVDQSVSCLQGADQRYTTIRPCIQKLELVANVSNIYLAIEPLTTILQNQSKLHDPITRSFAADMLGKISYNMQHAIDQESDTETKEGLRQLLSPYIIQSKSVLISTYQNSRGDLMRSGCIGGLSRVPGNDIYTMLVDAQANDPNIIVRKDACHALILRTRGSYISSTCNQPHSLDNQGSELGSHTITPDDLELYNWIGRHIIYSSIPIDSFPQQQGVKP